MSKQRYTYNPVLFDRMNPPAARKIEAGAEVIKIQPHGTPRNGTMGMTYIGDPETGEFIGMVMVNSLTKVVRLMRYMNEYDIEMAARQHALHPILGPAIQTLINLRDWTNRNSDGWPYWSKPARAADRLMELIEGDGTSYYRFDDFRQDVTVEKYKAALKPIKSFRTRQNADFAIIDLDGGAI